ncbi:MAG TPA: Asp-tRNA(Asn)/Glu-tRNA(Gln) amidotransferase subunit GatB [Patescibacteria group bacterium]|jgi:aspartyl-tRNA(Asn)/glutamyl-tRNA(Gln) amidotransferase subunit B|nr:Asp-tRNA(Asn)/Glu-tRNA(Gln) amidotransferase subunit GatB [Patescibacteria group bacterium]
MKLNGYKPVIGLEIHVQLATKSKMFGRAQNNPDEKTPNTNIDEVATGEPGTLPVINSEAVRLGVMAGLAMNCEIPEFSKFDRKHYFYPDLPKGYQISQLDHPVAGKGFVDIFVPANAEREDKPDAYTKRIRITRAHLEEDAGKNTHPDGLPYSLVDYNRAGCPLLEIVTEPDIETAEEARIFLTELRNIVRYVGASSADMEKGTMRCEPNISVRKPGEETLPKYKVEVKNINSFRFAEAAINYEIPRQIEMLEAGEMPKQVTMGWNEKQNITVEQRSKGEANDYRYMPEPDLPELHFTEEFIQKLRAELPELPGAKRVRFAEEFGLDAATIENLVSWKELNYYFEEVVSELDAWLLTEGNSENKELRAKLIKQAANWCLQDFSALLNAVYQNPLESKVSAENMAELVKLIDAGKISGSAAKQVFKVMFEKGGEPDAIVEELGLVQVSDEGAIEVAVDKVLTENEKAVADFKAGNQKAFGSIVGAVMKEMQGKANPQVVNELLKKKLS